MNSVHSGQNAGRACWVVSGTMCGGKVQGMFADKMGRCVLCDFYRKVKVEEARDFRITSELIDLMLAFR